MVSPPVALAILNNAISAELCRADLEARKIPLAQVVVILTREVEAPWLSACAQVLRYRGKPPGDLFGQRRVAGYYMQAATLARQLARTSDLRHVYLVNNDNLLCNHLLETARRRSDLEVTVVAEGLMNFQDITVRNRDSWRWQVKPAISALLGLSYRMPAGHLSGAYDPVVSRMVCFAASGVKAPPEKIVVRPFAKAEVRVKPRPEVGLIVHTGLWQWMSEDRYRPFATAFADWVRAQGFSKLYAKPHPRIATGLLEQLLPEHEILTTPQSLEEIAGDLEAATVIGTCCTGLVTLKLIRPDLRCVDFGGDYYCEHAYHGDRSVLDLLQATGVEVVPFAPEDLHENRAMAAG